jgi:hypothetical protein
VANHYRVEVLVDVPDLHQIRDRGVEFLYRGVVLAQNALGTALDISQSVCEQHDVDLSILELGAEDAVGLALNGLVPQERPGGPVPEVSGGRGE